MMSTLGILVFMLVQGYVVSNDKQSWMIGFLKEINFELLLTDMVQHYRYLNQERRAFAALPPPPPFTPSELAHFENLNANAWS